MADTTADASNDLMAELTALDAGVRDATPADDRRFYAGLVLALLAHGLLFVGFYGSPPRIIGDPAGSKDAVSVAFISEAELRTLAAQPDRPKGGPTPPPPPPSPAQAAPTSPPEPAKPAEPVTPTEPSPALPPKAQSATAVPPSALSLKPLDEVPLADDAQPEPPAKKPPPTPAAPTAPAKPKATPSRQAKLDLSPPVRFSGPMGGGAGLQRPPGITRSGENDAFARGVVSALQRTMPQLSNTRGRVTVRIRLDMNGSLVNTEVVRPSNVTDLDRYVVFATRQTSYPFPPRNAKPDDLIFLITYIYH